MDHDRLVRKQACERYWNAHAEAATADHARNEAIRRANKADTELNTAAQHLVAVSGPLPRYYRLGNGKVLVVTATGVSAHELTEG